jgi:spore coat protein U-like protein
MMPARAPALAGVTIAAFLAQPVSAAVVTTSFAVGAIVNKLCRVNANALNFGAYAPGAGARQAQSPVRVACTKGTAYSIALDAGSTAGGTFTQRLLLNQTAGDTDTLQYNLYTAAARTTVWGDGSAGTQTVGGTGTGLSRIQRSNVFGQLVDSASNQNVSAGTYRDRITVTVMF